MPLCPSCETTMILLTITVSMQYYAVAEEPRISELLHFRRFHRHGRVCRLLADDQVGEVAQDAERL